MNNINSISKVNLSISSECVAVIFSFDAQIIVIGYVLSIAMFISKDVCTDRYCLEQDHKANSQGSG